MTGWNVAEIAPAVPALAELLPPLAMLCILIICFGIVHGIDALVRGLFGTVKGVVGWIPYAGEVIASPIHKIEQKIVSFLSGLEQDIDHAIGHYWHSFAAVATHLWHTLERESELLWRTLQFLSGVPTLHELLHAERWLRHSIAAAAATAAHALRHAIHREERALRSVAHNVYPRIKALEHEVTRTLPREIRHARALAREAEDGVARLWNRVKTLERTLGAEAIAAAVATALAAIGLDWLGCRDGASRAGRSGCNLWDDLGAVFGLLAAAELALNFEQFVHEAQAATEATVTAVKDVTGL